MSLHHRAWGASALATLCSLLAVEARADESPLGLSVSIERVAGVAYASLRPTNSNATFGGTTFGIAGPAINPIALPRAAADVVLPVGLTLGGAVGYGNATLSQSPDSGRSSSFNGNAWLLSPRVGYALHLGPIFDLWPRAGVTLAGASLQNPDGQSCTSGSFGAGPVTTNCTTTPGDSESLFFAAASVEVAAVLRLTRTFNLLAGVAYDHVFAASGSTTRGGSTTSSDIHAEGKYLGGQLWLGLGGYVL
jgi:hypothetical protein